MDDLISRKAAIERIKLQMERPDTFGLWTRNDKIAEACYKIAIEILERLPSAETFSYGHENDWIPISERLPEETGEYLTTTMYGDVFCDHWQSCNFDRTEIVIAWMPLPKPYKAGEQE